MKMTKEKRREVNRLLTQKRRRGELPPQKCANAACGRSLADPSVPNDKKVYAPMFSLALEHKDPAGKVRWVCPFCQYQQGPAR